MGSTQFVKPAFALVIRDMQEMESNAHVSTFNDFRSWPKILLYLKELQATTASNPYYKFS